MLFSFVWRGWKYLFIVSILIMLFDKIFFNSPLKNCQKFHFHHASRPLFFYFFLMICWLCQNLLSFSWIERNIRKSNIVLHPQKMLKNIFFGCISLHFIPLVSQIQATLSTLKSFCVRIYYYFLHIELHRSLLSWQKKKFYDLWK